MFYAAGGALLALQYCLQDRPVVADNLLELDVISVLTDILSQVSPVDWVSSAGFARKGHGQAFQVVTVLVDSAQAGGRDLTEQMLTSKHIERIVLALKAVQKIGADKVSGMVVINGPLWTLKSLYGEALGEIEDRLRACTEQLRYLKNSRIWIHEEGMGITSSVFATLVGANLYGKDEDNTFGFKREYMYPKAPRANEPGSQPSHILCICVVAHAQRTMSTAFSHSR